MRQEALALLNLVGARLLPCSAGYVGGLWKDLDGAESRTALRIIQPQAVEVVPLEDADLPSAYQVWQCRVRHQGETLASGKQRAFAGRKRLAA